MKQIRAWAGTAQVSLGVVCLCCLGTAASNAQSWPPPVAPAGQMDPGPGWPPELVNVTRPLPGKPFKEGYVDVDGYHLLYIDGGKGPTVVVSFTGSGGLEMSTAKDMLAQRYRVIEINPPGWGPDSNTPRDSDMKKMARVFVHALDKLGVGKFHLIGTSAGCVHAMLAAEQYPDRVLSLTGEGGECFTRPEDRRQQTARAVAAQDAARAGKGFDDDYSIWAGWPAYQWAPNKWWQTPSYQARLMRRRYVRVNTDGGQNEREMMENTRADMIAQAATLKVPTVDFLGDRDEIMKMTVAQSWKKNMPQSRFVLVAGGTHDLQNSQPEQFVELLEACSLDTSPSKLRCPAD
jgi:pimeloyl-ACP methyl ester carboxylesterase